MNEIQRTFPAVEERRLAEVRQSGSHVILNMPTKLNSIPIPFHGNKEVKKGTLQSILKMAEIDTRKR